MTPSSTPTQRSELSTPGWTWGRYLESLVSAHGSLAAVAMKLAHSENVDADATSIERALRRLRTRENREGGQYGRWLLRTFGVPQEIEHRARWMGVYHSRFTDLPVSLCLDALRLWDRPPVSESRARVWLALGWATCALRLGELANAETHLARARGGRTSDAARIETLLVEGYVASRKLDRARVASLLADVEPLLASHELARDERMCLQTRWLDQRAYQRLHPTDGTEPDVAGALALYEHVPSGDVPIFVTCKRESGLAYVHHRLGDRERAAAHARRAITHAGDGGFVRLRIAYLGLLAHITEGQDDEGARTRALRAARGLEDEDLVVRLERTPPTAV